MWRVPALMAQGTEPWPSILRTAGSSLRPKGFVLRDRKVLM
jgi:hypothetical protein